MGSGCSIGRSTEVTPLQKTIKVPGLKIAVVGDPEVGKSSILARYIHNQYSPIYIPTRKVAIENVVRKLNVPGHATVPVTLWDIPGREELSLHESYFRNLDAVIVVVDLSDQSSIESGQVWRQTVVSSASFSSPQAPEHQDSNTGTSEIIDEDREQKAEEEAKRASQIPCLLLGNKSDLIHTRVNEGGEAVTEITEDGLKAENVKLLENVGNGFVGSVMVSAKLNDLSVHAAIQNFLRLILERKYVDRRWRAQEKVARSKRARYEFKPQLESVGVGQIDEQFAQAEEVIYRVNCLKLYQEDSLAEFAEHCADIGVIQSTLEGSMQNCLVALRDKLASLDLKLKLTLEDFCTLEVKASTQDAELEKSIRYAVKCFNKEYAQVTKAMLQEYPLAISKLEKLEKRVAFLCESHEVSRGQANENGTLTTSQLHALALKVERNRAVMRHSVHTCQHCLEQIQDSVKKVKAAFVW